MLKISAYDKVVQLVTYDNTEVKPPQEEPTHRVHMSVKKHIIFFRVLNSMDKIEENWSS